MFPALSCLNPFGKRGSETLLLPHSSVSPPSPQLSLTTINSCLSHNTTLDASLCSSYCIKMFMRSCLPTREPRQLRGWRKTHSNDTWSSFRFIPHLQTGSSMLTKLLHPTPHQPTTTPSPFPFHSPHRIYKSPLKPLTPPSHPLSANGLASGPLRTEEKANTLHLSYPPPGAVEAYGAWFSFYDQALSLL